MSEEPIVVYTCITGGYDALMRPGAVEPGVDYVFVGDAGPVATPGWRHLPLPPLSGDAAQRNRYAKMHPHLLFPHHRYSLYLDGNIELLGGVREVVQRALQEGEIAMYRHSFRSCVYQEAAVCASLGHDWGGRIARQMDRYRRAGFPPEAGLFEANVIVRNHASAAVQRLMEGWWREYLSGVRRDQLSLTYLAWQQGTKVVDLGVSDAREAQRHFRLHLEHSKKAPLARRVRGWINRHTSLAGLAALGQP